MSDGSFSKLQATEIQSIRKAFVEFKKEVGKPTACENCGGQLGCLHCCPPMTFLVCNTRNKVKIVPSDPKIQNVLSGTCLDEIIMDFQTLKVTPPPPQSERTLSEQNVIYTEPDGKGYDFIIVPHGGRMGTSKTVHYRCILNENAVFRSSSGTTPLTKPKLEELTYHMSYQYTTASKVSKLIDFKLLLFLIILDLS